MKKGFTKLERKDLEKHLEGIDSAIDALLEFLREKHQKAEEWIDERSESWFDSDNGLEFEDWVGELDFKIDELENLKDELSLEAMEDVL